MTNSLQSQIQTIHKNYVWKCIKTVNACDTSLTDIPKPLGYSYLNTNFNHIYSTDTILADIPSTLDHYSFYKLLTNHQLTY